MRDRQTDREREKNREREIWIYKFVLFVSDNSIANQAGDQLLHCVLRTWLRCWQRWPRYQSQLVQITCKLSQLFSCTKAQSSCCLRWYWFLVVQLDQSVIMVPVFLGWEGGPCGRDPFNTLDLRSATPSHCQAFVFTLLSQTWKPISSPLRTNVSFYQSIISNTCHCSVCVCVSVCAHVHLCVCVRVCVRVW